MTNPSTPDQTGDEPGGEVPVTRLEINELLNRVRNIEAELRNTQALVARTYEQTFAWDQALKELRNSQEYETAFDPEPLISVRVATFNLAEILCERALASLRRQSYERWEAHIIGDHCTDDTEERIRKLNDPRITFTNLPWRGPYPDNAKARWYVAGIGPANVGLAAARGAWIAPLDHDDEWDDDHLEHLLEGAQSNRAELAYGRIRNVDAGTGQFISETGTWPPKRGDFGFLASIHHAGLRRFRYDPNCRFADEPGDWNLARRMWDAGVRFHFVNRVVATAHFTPRHADLTTEQWMIEDLRNWATQLQEGLQFWKEQADRSAAEVKRLHGISEDL
jgi:glycosyltransferase involved in cell wall biosynthesis